MNDHLSYNIQRDGFRLGSSTLRKTALYIAADMLREDRDVGYDGNDLPLETVSQEIGLFFWAAEGLTSAESDAGLRYPVSALEIRQALRSSAGPSICSTVSSQLRLRNASMSE